MQGLTSFLGMISPSSVMRREFDEIISLFDVSRLEFEPTQSSSAVYNERETENHHQLLLLVQNACAFCFKIFISDYIIRLFCVFH
jgi:hypothetical protein